MEGSVELSGLVITCQQEVVEYTELDSEGTGSVGQIIKLDKRLLFD